MRKPVQTPVASRGCGGPGDVVAVNAESHVQSLDTGGNVSPAGTATVMGGSLWF